MDREREREQKRGYGMRDTEGKINFWEWSREILGFVEDDEVFEFDRLQKYFDLRSMRIESRETTGSREESLLNENGATFPHPCPRGIGYCLGRSCSFSITKIG